MDQLNTIYDIVGASKLEELTAAFYRRVAKDEVLRPMYPADLAPAEERLRWFLWQVFGGPRTYSEHRGHPRLRMRHFEWPIDDRARQHWLNNMLAAMEEVKLPEEAKQPMQQYFVQVANHMINQ
ncbi:globin domain-containing protein [Penaeicola halotolerans]|uniref:globin domain-containing protein n=1 Tax=Penaeicola halotolerans TaxID=2793196 RepID=UPI001CF7FCC9|nr:cyanoglobin [Penaeicola halotolerans]